jgi:hypothetical protein
MNAAPIPGPRKPSRGWQSLFLAATVCALGLAHQRATATGLFRAGGPWDQTAVAVAQWRERLGARRAAVVNRPVLVREQAPFQRFDHWSSPPHYDRYPQWEIVWDERCGPPRQCGPWYPAAAPQHCGPWGRGW